VVGLSLIEGIQISALDGPALGGQACGAYLVVLVLSIICFMKAMAASGVG
jgi:hypothetical protein